MAQLWQWKSERFNQEKHEMLHLIGIHAEFCSHLVFFLTGIMKGFNQQKHEMFHLIGIHEEFCSHLFFF